MASGVVIALVAFGLVFHVDDHLAKISAPWYDLPAGQGRRQLERQARAREAPRRRRKRWPSCTRPPGNLPDYGVAPPIHADGDWINSKPLTLAQLRGKVVLIDFWTYSCINCLRTLPHLEAWNATYRKQGLVIIGVHTPEFAFEHVSSNVRAAVKRLGIKYPVVQDNRFKTWDNYANQYWPAEYLIDKTGHVRHTHFGEGEYGETEQLIRRLLGDDGAQSPRMPDTTPTGLLTPETLPRLPAPAQLRRDARSRRTSSRRTACPRSCRRTRSPTAGSGSVGARATSTAVRDSHLALHFHAKNVYIVLGGHGTVRASIDGGREDDPVTRRGSTRCARRSARPTRRSTCAFTPGVQAYSFTFG